MTDEEIRKLVEALSACTDPYELLSVMDKLEVLLPDTPWSQMVTVLGRPFEEHRQQHGWDYPTDIAGLDDPEY